MLSTRLCMYCEPVNCQVWVFKARSRDQGPIIIILPKCLWYLLGLWSKRKHRYMMLPPSYMLLCQILHNWEVSSFLTLWWSIPDSLKAVIAVAPTLIYLVIHVTRLGDSQLFFTFSISFLLPCNPEAWAPAPHCNTKQVWDTQRYSSQFGETWVSPKPSAS